MMLRALILLHLCVSTSAVFGWWNEDWSERSTISINTTPTGANLSGPLNETSVLLRLHAGNFPGFLTVRDGGADLRLIAADDLTSLKYHVERFDPISQMAMVWVKLPSIAPQSTTDSFFLYYGNAAAPNADEANASFDVSTAAAFHFNETQGTPVDSSAYATPISSGDFFSNPASIIGTGITLPGTSPLVIDDNGALLMSADLGWTVSAWVRFSALPEQPVVIFERLSNDEEFVVSLEQETISAKINDSETSSLAPVVAGQWHHLAVVLANGRLELFLDGKPVGAAPAELGPMSGPLFVGGTAESEGLAAFDLDELRIDVTGRTADWIAFSAAVQGPGNDALITYGGAESSEGGAEGGHHGGGGHFATIWYSVFGPGGPLIERIVIIICGIMALIAIAVMFFKALFLAKARRATNSFESAFALLKINASKPEEQFGSLVSREKRFGNSPLFKVYKIAAEQVNARQQSPSVGAAGAGFDSKTISSIRTSMDSQMVRESQKMNSWMVLLTIAISGGPFIGLLGTVVGVMTTFGAIAATGDINITAIAPGMAAALLATVAGLGVAIPALFGYNYLGSKIKELTADMSVFSDELTARITEEYGA